MRIIILDGHTLNPGDLAWDDLQSLGECTVYARTPAELVVERARGAEAVITNKVVLDRGVLEQLPDLRYIGVAATGYNVVDSAAARERGVTVTNVPTYGTQSVAQMTFALLLELCHHVGHHAWTVREGRWSASEDFCYWDYPLIELAGLTMGLIGFGRIGQATARIASAFGLQVLAYDPSCATSPIPEVELTDLRALLTRSDIVSLHCPLTAENRGLIDTERIGWMKPTALLLNTARGPLVREDDLAAALRSGRLAGAALDVLTVEPPPADNPLLTAPNCLITPHIAWATRAARARLMQTLVENLRAFLAGKPVNVV